MGSFVNRDQCSNSYIKPQQPHSYKHLTGVHIHNNATKQHLTWRTGVSTQPNYSDSHILGARGRMYSESFCRAGVWWWLATG